MLGSVVREVREVYKECNCTEPTPTPTHCPYPSPKVCFSDVKNPAPPPPE